MIRENGKLVLDRSAFPRRQLAALSTAYRHVDAIRKHPTLHVTVEVGERMCWFVGEPRFILPIKGSGL